MRTQDWATKKNSKIHALVFEDMCGRMPGKLVSDYLLAPLTSYLSEGRSDFTKSECFRILAKLLTAMEKNDNANDLDEKKICAACKAR